MLRKRGTEGGKERKRKEKEKKKGNERSIYPETTSRHGELPTNSEAALAESVRP